MKQEVVEWLNTLDDWEEKYLLLIDLGKALPLLPEEDKNSQNRVRGCTSRVWVVGSVDEGGQLIINGDSDSRVVKGLLGLLVKIYSGSRPEEILADESNLAQELGLSSNLMPTRVVGFEAMQERIRQLAASARGFG